MGGSTLDLNDWSTGRSGLDSLPSGTLRWPHLDTARIQYRLVVKSEPLGAPINLSRGSSSESELDLDQELGESCRVVVEREPTDEGGGVSVGARGDVEQLAGGRLVDGGEDPVRLCSTYAIHASNRHGWHGP